MVEYTERNVRNHLLDHPVLFCNDVSGWMSTVVERTPAGPVKDATVGSANWSHEGLNRNKVNRISCSAEKYLPL